MGRLIRGVSKNARFFATDTTDVVQKAIDIHNYDIYSSDIFGKFCTLAVLMGSTLKGEDKLTIRTDTEGYIKNIIVNSDSKGNIKAYLVNGNEESYDSLGKGMMRIIKDMGLKEPYTAVANIDYLKLANDISYYFYNSEQIPTVISFAMEFTNDNRVLCAGAYMIQLLPNADEEFITKLERKIEAIRPMNELMKGGMSLEKIINLLYDDMDTEDDSLVEEYQILEEKEINYNCDCSSDRFYRGLLTLGAEELTKIFDEEGEIQTECQFCSKKYKFERKHFLEVLTNFKRG
ncbi:Hsp33 family molecular chaperone HslO [Fusobacterium russii]|uniref:Hsp33 family molecular chaperone HslO n=1 Tax=Fusobacterium russii TaxID=854 RepID=UPI0003AAE449|nr:Hsp33 family molecular chaperone HslO [Fusobacterium russii]